MVERPVRAPATTFRAGNISGDVAVVFELVEVPRDRGTRHALTECGDELRSAETTPMLGQRDGDGELDEVHAHTDQRVQSDGDRGVGVGRHPPIVSVVRGKGRRDTNAYFETMSATAPTTVMPPDDLPERTAELVSSPPWQRKGRVA